MIITKDDLISRSALLAEYDKVHVGIPGKARKLIEDAPSAQRKGKWIATQEWGGRNYSCSCCKFSFMVDTCMHEPMRKGYEAK